MFVLVLTVNVTFLIFFETWVWHLIAFPCRGFEIFFFSQPPLELPKLHFWFEVVCWHHGFQPQTCKRSYHRLIVKNSKGILWSFFFTQSQGRSRYCTPRVSVMAKGLVWFFISLTKTVALLSPGLNVEPHESNLCSVLCSSSYPLHVTHSNPGFQRPEITVYS